MPKNTIQVAFQKKAPGVSSLWVSSVIRKTVVSERSKRNWVSVLVTTDAEIRKINRRFLDHDYATDVISFEAPRENSPAGESDYLGDVVVSFEMARSMASEIGIPFKEELARYLVHGTLHLLGYDDHKPADRRKMFDRQEKILRSFFPSMTDKGKPDSRAVKK